MLSVKFMGNAKATVVDRPMPQPRPGEVLLKVGASAICGSEMRTYRAPEPRADIPGHEMAGTVVENANPFGPRVGDRVGVYANTGCGKCFYCLKGDRRLCPEHTVVGHGHAEYVAVPAQCCLPLPDDVPFAIGVLLCGDTVGVGFHALSMVRPAPRDTVAVIGVGPVGSGFLATLTYLGIRSIAVEVSPFRRALAERLGASHVVDPAATDPLAALRELTDGRGVDIAVNASGQNAGVNLAMAAVRTEGKVVIPSAGRDATLGPWDQYLDKEITAYCTYYFSDADYVGMLEAHRTGLKAADLLTHRFHLEAASQAYELFSTGQTGKVVFVPREQGA